MTSPGYIGAVHAASTLFNQDRINRYTNHGVIKEKLMGYYQLSKKLVARRRAFDVPSLSKDRCLCFLKLKDEALTGEFVNKKYILELVVTKGDLNFYICSTGRTLREVFKDFRFRYEHQTNPDCRKVMARFSSQNKSDAPVGSIYYEPSDQEYYVRVDNKGYQDWRLLKEDGTYKKPEVGPWEWR